MGRAARNHRGALVRIGDDDDGLGRNENRFHFLAIRAISMRRLLYPGPFAKIWSLSPGAADPRAIAEREGRV